MRQGGRPPPPCHCSHSLVLHRWRVLARPRQPHTEFPHNADDPMQADFTYCSSLASVSRKASPPRKTTSAGLSLGVDQRRKNSPSNSIKTIGARSSGADALPLCTVLWVGKVPSQHATKFWPGNQYANKQISKASQSAEQTFRNTLYFRILNICKSETTERGWLGARETECRYHWWHCPVALQEGTVGGTGKGHRESSSIISHNCTWSYSYCNIKGNLK